MFHYGLFVVLMGHLMGLLIPKAWTDLVVSQEAYHAVALGAGTVAGVATLAGIALLIYRRPHRSARCSWPPPATTS